MQESMLPQDPGWIRLALHEAARGIGTTSPNPPVGAVIVAADGRTLLGKGHHQVAGGPHAEIQALRNISPSEANQLPGATAYVTLEPCTTHGRTPPCAQALVDAGVSRVVWAIDDPNPAHAGRARAFFHNHGIATHSGVHRAAATALLGPWAARLSRARPYVVAKMGTSLDSRLTLPPGEGQWLTSPASRADAMRLRLASDAVLVGGNTARVDSPALTLRPAEIIPPHKLQPWRLVWTTSGQIGENNTLLTDAHAHRTRLLSAKDPLELLQNISSHGELSGIVQILLEGGASVLTQFLQAGLVDELHCYIAPRISGSGITSISEHFWVLDNSINLTLRSTKTIGQDIKIVYAII